MKWNLDGKKRWHASFEWHPWFAWYPVQLESGAWAWRETVMRRRVSSWYEFFWKYKDSEAADDEPTYHPLFGSKQW